jgi:hypothetical protein
MRGEVFLGMKSSALVSGGVNITVAYRRAVTTKSVRMRVRTLRRSVRRIDDIRKSRPCSQTENLSLHRELIILHNCALGLLKAIFSL